MTLQDVQQPLTRQVMSFSIWALTGLVKVGLRTIATINARCFPELKNKGYILQHKGNIIRTFQWVL
jgi:hypothetical protein